MLFDVDSLSEEFPLESLMEGEEPYLLDSVTAVLLKVRESRARDEESLFEDFVPPSYDKSPEEELL